MQAQGCIDGLRQAKNAHAHDFDRLDGWLRWRRSFLRHLLLLALLLRLRLADLLLARCAILRKWVDIRLVGLRDACDSCVASQPANARGNGLY